MLNRIIICFFSFLFQLSLIGQTKYSSAEILQQLDRLNTLGAVLYVAAHPDDENTQMISYLANGKLLKTGYLAATRGDGGQNLIGPEISEALGVIRTQELMAARRTDGGEQFFSRAIDFGYSKDPNETFNKWNRQEVLADFVWVIRNFRPDVMITRFNRELGVTHGHHTASAMLAMEAFQLSADPEAFPEQLKYVDPWEVKKIFWNTSSWFFQRNEKPFDPDDYLKVDVGQYDAELGMSYTEIAALSRSMHRSQGFGASGGRGSEYEYLEQWGGPKSDEMFGDIDCTWSRVEGSELVSMFLEEARANFDPRNPAQILGELIKARAELLRLPDQYWKEVKMKELEKTILMVTGTFIELTSAKPSYSSGDSITLNLEIINRSTAPIRLSSVRFSIDDESLIYKMNLIENESIRLTYELLIPEKMGITHPYWLMSEGSEGMYDVSSQRLIGQPDSPPAVTGVVTISVEDQFMDFRLPVIYKTTDPVGGEKRRSLEIMPEVMLNMDNNAMIFGNGASRQLTVRLTAGEDSVSGELALKIPSGWRVFPEKAAFAIPEVFEQQDFVFELWPPKKQSIGSLRAEAKVNGKTYDRGRLVIDYDHIPEQTIYPKAVTKIVKLDIERGESNKIGYIMGAGDAVPESLRQLGYTVDLLDKEQVNLVELSQFDAVILGIRAFNTVPWLASYNKVLFEYVRSGGNLIVQYNTSHRLVTEEIAPLPLKLSRKRVAVEDAPVQMIAKSHPVLTFPNKLSSVDFSGWVQERGLYFPGEWSPEFVPILSMGDPGEDVSEGSLLVAQYGKGYFCYTGLSFFRELPAGVPGAYKLLVNMIALDSESNVEK